MSIVDIRKAFVNASQGVLTLLECTLHYVPGPDGEREHQLLRFVVSHGASQRRLVVNPHPEMDQHRTHPDFDYVHIEAVPPNGDLYEATKAAALKILEEVGDHNAFKDGPPPKAAFLGD